MNDKEFLFWDVMLSGDASGAIERSEKREQQEVVRNERLPLRTNDHTVPREIRELGTEELRANDNVDWSKVIDIERTNNQNWTKEQYERMGIKIISEYDDLFFNVELPEGWELKPTSHSMWNDVFDNKGRKRISFFYKGAFYDREAFSNFEKRYYYSEVPFDDYKSNATYEERKAKEWYGIAYDCDREIFRTEPIINKDYFDRTLINQCKEYLDNNYPNWQNINAYWD